MKIGMLLPCLYWEHILLAGVTKLILEKELGTKPDSLQHLFTCNVNIFWEDVSSVLYSEVLGLPTDAWSKMLLVASPVTYFCLNSI